MTRAELLHSPASGVGTAVNTADTPPVPNLRDAVAGAVHAYLKELDGQISRDVYQMVLTEVEAPLLEAVMKYTRNNQTRASLMLGLNRGTLRKKLKQYDLLDHKH